MRRLPSLKAESKPKAESRREPETAKSEIRNPKSEGNLKTEIRNPKRKAASGPVIQCMLRRVTTKGLRSQHRVQGQSPNTVQTWPSDFGFRISCRISDFGFRILSPSCSRSSCSPSPLPAASRRGSDGLESNRGQAAHGLLAEGRKESAARQGDETEVDGHVKHRRQARHQRARGTRASSRKQGAVEVTVAVGCRGRW